MKKDYTQPTTKTPKTLLIEGLRKKPIILQDDDGGTADFRNALKDAMEEARNAN